MGKQDKGQRQDRGDRGGGFTNSPFRKELKGFKVGVPCLACERPITKVAFGHGYMHVECERASGPSTWTMGPGNWPKRMGKRQDWDPLVAVEEGDGLVLTTLSRLTPVER